jgi:SPP1 gp7 family putative phage head morphogenesis protein
VISLLPIVTKDSYSAAVERQLLAYLEEVVYGPLLEILREAGLTPQASDQRMNAVANVIEVAIRSGRVFYSKGVFSGQFAPAVARELRRLGARFNDRTHEFTLPEDRFPDDLKIVASIAQSKAQELHSKISATLAQMAENIPQTSSGMIFDRAAASIADDLNRQFDRSVNPLEAISIPADITETVRAKLDERLTKNLDLDIRDWSANEVLSLRQKAEAHAFAGGRADGLARIIESSYGVSKRKAAFLAAQETSLAVSEYRQTHFEAIGCTHYRWVTVKDFIVRDDHKDLDGHIFAWADPPIADKRSGTHANPGEFYGCRCRAVPMIPTPMGTLI